MQKKEKEKKQKKNPDNIASRRFQNFAERLGSEEEGGGTQDKTQPNQGILKFFNQSETILLFVTNKTWDTKPDNNQPDERDAVVRYKGVLSQEITEKSCMDRLTSSTPSLAEVTCQQFPPNTKVLA